MEKESQINAEVQSMAVITIERMELAVRTARPKYLKSKTHQRFVSQGYSRPDHISLYWEGKAWENAVFAELE